LGDKNAESRDKKVAGVTSVFRNTTHCTDEQQSDIGIKSAYQKSAIDAMKVVLQCFSGLFQTQNYSTWVPVHGAQGVDGSTIIFSLYAGYSTPKI